jgi:hypothetical protein
MSDSLVSFIFDDNTIRGNDNLVNITALASVYKRATGIRKDTRDWLVTKEATESIAYLERVTGIPVSQLVSAEHGVGTWVHPDLAEIFAQWCSVEYWFAVVRLIRTAKDNNLPQVPEPPRRLAPQRDLIDYLAKLWESPQPYAKRWCGMRTGERGVPSPNAIYRRRK